jgi:hypothetical protein
MTSLVNRLIAATALLLVLLVVVVVIWSRAEEGEPSDVTEARDRLPLVSADAVTSLEVQSPGKPLVRIAKQDGEWNLVEPIQAAANANYVELALRKLAELPSLHHGVAGTRPENHERLGVAEHNGMQVIAKEGDVALVHLFIGLSKGGLTLIRVAGDDQVHSLRGSHRETFEREVDDWRERKVTDEVASQVREARFESERGSFRFVRQAGGMWHVAKSEPAIEAFSSIKVESVVATLSRMRAVGFAEEGTAQEQAGITDGSGTATLVLDDDRAVILRLGSPTADGKEFYLMRDGRDALYRVSAFVGERIAAGPYHFTEGAQAPNAEGELPAGVTKEDLDQILRTVQRTPIRADQAVPGQAPSSD